MPHLPHFLPIFLQGTLFLGSRAGATNCAFSSFEQTVKTADVVVQVEVVQQRSKVTGPQAEFQARVIAVYAGKVPKGDLHILGAAGLDTYPSVQQFPPGTRWVMALDTHDLRGNTLPKTVYAPAGCVQQGLLVSGPVAYGILQGGPVYASVASSIRLSELPAWVQARR